MRAVEYRRFQDGPRWRNLLLGKAAALHHPGVGGIRSAWRTRRIWTR